MSQRISPPPFESTFNQGNAITEIWKKFILDLQRFAATGGAPSDATYIVTEDNPDLTNEINLGLMSTGWLHISVAALVATVTSLSVLYTAMEPSGDVTIPANMGAVVPDHFTIAPGKTLTLSPGAVLQIL